MDDFEAFDLLDSGIEFDPSNWPDLAVLFLVIVFSLGGAFYAKNEQKNRESQPTHQYNRETGEVEELDK
ncbi:hypothetical protein VB715_18525 [Crocosphaera sp. UHCC 0190]|uniref:hypothetical protein n=1 Tax=Crocosphaera sp. UHCC 0190 TaxID=3110246 RepID=UPI002B20CE1F|nr:hypothetical protein [Crocosphaera sp. UHCC 0190]MEA5511771.1 hypothetical protein [Crocosphaera sp. UHCC 0190]